MRVLIDTNRIIAALTKAGTSRDILFDGAFEFITPDHSITEIEKHKEELQQKTKLNEEEFELLLSLVLEYVTITPFSEYHHFIERCKNNISDPDDIPHLAAALACKAEGIWAHDPHFKEQNKVKVFTNIDMLRLSGKSKSI